jgi:hypothetical protein
MKNTDDLMKPLLLYFKEALLQAFEQGYEEGTRDARNRLSDYTNQLSTLTVSPLTNYNRAPRGFVEPAIVAVIKSHPGLRPKDIAERGGLNEHSVRGLLQRLLKAHLVVKKDGLWYLPQESEQEG